MKMEIRCLWKQNMLVLGLLLAYKKTRLQGQLNHTKAQPVLTVQAD